MECPQPLSLSGEALWWCTMRFGSTAKVLAKRKFMIDITIWAVDALLPLVQGPEMYRTVRSSVMHAVMSGSLPGEQGEKLLQGYKRFLQSYTYLN